MLWLRLPQEIWIFRLRDLLSSMINVFLFYFCAHFHSTDLPDKSMKIYRHLYVRHLILIVNWLCCSCKMPKIQAAKPKRQLRWIFHSFGSVRAIINNRLQLFTARQMPDKFLAQWYARDIDSTASTVGISREPIDGDIFLFLYLNVCAFICCSLYSPPCHQVSPTLTLPIDDINNAEHINGAPTINS